MAGNQQFDPDTISTVTSLVMDTLIKTGAVQGPKKGRKNVMWENMLAREYVENNYREMPHWYRIEVGPFTEGKESTWYTKTRRWCDAIIRMPNRMMIIETKMRPKPDVVGQIKNYDVLFPQTPLFSKYANEPRDLVVVCAMIDAPTKQFIEDNDVAVVIYKPTFYEKWYKMMIEKNSNLANTQQM